MTLLTIAATLYVIGLVFFLFMLFAAAAHEPTAHGQSIIFTIGLLLVLGWPLTLLWCLILEVGSGIAWVWRVLRGRA